MSINLDLLDNLKGKFVEGECLEERKGEREMGGGKRSRESEDSDEAREKGRWGKKESAKQGGREGEHSVTGMMFFSSRLTFP